MYLSQLENQPITRELADKIVYEGLSYSSESAPCAIFLAAPKATSTACPRP